MERCSLCGKAMGALPYKCRYCGNDFCAEHRLPENHNCEGLEKWKRGELKEFKKEVTSKHTTFSELSKPAYDPTRFPVPHWLAELTRDKRKMMYVLWAVASAIILIAAFYVWAG